MTAFDMLGIALVPGDFVAYGVRDGSSGGLKVGIIKEIKQVEKKYHPGEFTYRIRVRGATSSWFNSADGFTTTDNMIKLFYLPTEIANTLKDHYVEWIKKASK